MLSSVETNVRTKMRSDTDNILGKKIVIAGDVAGIGRATAAMLVERGAKIFMGVSSSAELTATFVSIAQIGGEWDGMVVGLDRPAEIRRFFDQAESRLCGIDVLVSLLPYEKGTGRDEYTEVHRLFLEEALRRMNSRPGSQVISLGAAGRGIPAVLRHEASEKGIRMTLIDPGTLVHSKSALATSEPAMAFLTLEAQDVARCVFYSVAQGFGPDVVFLQNQYRHQPL